VNDTFFVMIVLFFWGRVECLFVIRCQFVDPCTGFVAESSNEKLHADSFSIMGFQALMLVPIEHFCKVFTCLGSPMGLIFIRICCKF
jgi:hypothetical protein